MKMLKSLGPLAIVVHGGALAQGAVVQTGEVRAELVAYAPRGVAPGAPVWLGLALTHQPHWHSYWKNPGDSGMATTFRWALPEGVAAGEVEWPAPQRLPVGPLVNYGYEGDVLLPVGLTLPTALRAGALDVKLHAQWLVCKDVCIPQSGDFALSVPVAPSTQHAAAFARARAALPQQLAGVSARARVQGLVLNVEAAGLPAPWRGQAMQFFAEDGGVVDHAALARQQWDGEVLRLHVALSAQRSESPQPMRAVLAVTGERSSVALNFTVEGGWPALGTAPLEVQTPAPTAASERLPLLVWLAPTLAALALGAAWVLQRARR